MSSLDRDCGHVYDIHDNCPDVFNPDQRDFLPVSSTMQMLVCPINSMSVRA